MSKFPVYRVGSTYWDTFGADGFNEYGYNEQGYDRKGTRHIVFGSRPPQWIALDDSEDAIVPTRKEFGRYGISGNWVTDFFFGPRDEEKPWVRGDCLIEYICYSQAAAPGIREADWALGGNYMLIAGLDRNEADEDDLRRLSEYIPLGYR